ncbi:MAG TPA: acyltransferase [Acidimicrobiales bacterium]|nr:acyltransferase [Acidimicrobiales bacterium]
MGGTPDLRGSPGRELAVRGRHLPALDGVRALAILGVIAYHLGAGWASGGFLGVDLFFVLSGFLITSLLLEEKEAEGRLHLGAFWGRRARRLLPGLLLMLVALGAFYSLAGPGPLVDLGQVRGDAVATVLYVANWHLLLAHQSYFDQFAAPSPLQHTWSLGIEEQFYLLWPLALAGVLALSRGRWRWSGGLLAAAGACASAIWMAVLASGGASTNRLYYGTDTRAFDLLTGAVLAFAVAARPQPRERGRRILGVAGPTCLLALLVFWWRAGGGGANGAPGRAMFEWGFLVCALLAAVVLADARQERLSPLGRVLALAPLRFVGVISYELYLWHWPVICELTPARLGFGGAALDSVRLGVTLALAAGSFYLVDQPIRRGALRRLPAAARAAAAPLGMAAAVLAMVIGTMPAAAAVPETVRDVATHGPGVPGAGGMVGGPIRLAAVPSRRHRLRIVLFGDSVMRDDAAAIQAALDSTGEVRVRDDGFDGWGFTTDTGWRQGVPAQIRADHAQLVIAMWSFDDDYLVHHRAQYRKWLGEFVRLVLAQRGVEGLIFQQFPPIGPAEVANPIAAAASERANNGPIDAWNAMARSMVALDPRRVMYLPIAPAVERDGRFTSFLPPGNDWALPASHWVRVRSVDNVHFCPAGAARYAAALVADLTAMYHLSAPNPSWPTWPWSRGAQFDQPPGNCPADHP